MAFSHLSKAPAEIDPNYEDWYVQNQQAKDWLLSSMNPEIMKRYIRLETAKEICDALSTTFYDGSDEELGHRDKVIMACDKDIKAYQKSIERQHVHIFIAGLDAELEQVGGEILRKNPVPELQESYVYVRREVDRRDYMQGELEQQEGSAMVA